MFGSSLGLWRSRFSAGILFLAVLLIPLLAVIASAQTPPAPVAVGTLKDGWEEIDQRLVFLTVELSSVEASIDAVNKAIHASGYELESKQDAAEHARKGNEIMDRNGGGPLAWSDFYGQTAQRFYYRPSGEVVVEVAPQGRPPQLDYIYRANAKNQQKAEADAAKLGNKIDQLRSRRSELETEQSALWCKISFRAVSSKEVGDKPIYRFDLTTTATDAASQPHLQALTAGRDFVRIIITAIDDAQKSVDTNQQQTFEQLQQTVATARADLRDKMDRQPSLAIELADSRSALGQFCKLAKRLDESAQNIVDASKLTNDDASTSDEQRKTVFRGQLQGMLMDFAQTTVASDASIASMASQWKITPDLTTAAKSAATPTVAATAPGDADSITAALEQAKAASKQSILDSKKTFVAAIDARIDSAADAGDLNAVKSLRAAKASAESDGTLPEDATDASIVAAKARYDKDIQAANAQLAAAYREAVRALTKAHQFDQAQAVQTELDALPQAPSGDSTAEQFKVVTAKFGDGSRLVDVTTKVAELLKAGGTIQSQMPGFPDPAPGIRKTLTVVMTVSGRAVKLSGYGDGTITVEKADSPVAGQSVPISDHIQLESASYGSDSRMADVRREAARLLKFKKPIRTEHTDFGIGDPAFGVTKTLTIQVRIDGVSYLFAVQDGGQISLNAD